MAFFFAVRFFFTRARPNSSQRSAAGPWERPASAWERSRCVKTCMLVHMAGWQRHLARWARQGAVPGHASPVCLSQRSCDAQRSSAACAACDASSGEARGGGWEEAQGAAHEGRRAGLLGSTQAPNSSLTRARVPAVRSASPATTAATRDGTAHDDVRRHGDDDDDGRGVQADVA